MWPCSLMAVSSCIAIPFPWFPNDPYATDIVQFLDEEAVDRERVVATLGMPWANLGSDVFLYLADKASGYVLIVVGYSGGFAPINRDYFLAVNFDERGEVSGYETHVDSLRHDFCFESGICLAHKTFNIPLAPTDLDEEAKRFESISGKCVVYIYRDDVGEGLAENSYVDISISVDDGSFRRLATSVEHGYSRFVFTPAKQLELKFNLPPHSEVNQAGWFDNDPATEQRTPERRSIPCEAGSVSYFRLYVPEKNSMPIEFEAVEAGAGQEKISKLKLLLERRLFLASELNSGEIE